MSCEEEDDVHSNNIVTDDDEGSTTDIPKKKLLNAQLTGITDGVMNITHSVSGDQARKGQRSVYIKTEMYFSCR
jgi:hypothetical protein